MLPKDRDIAMVFQNCALCPHMSVFDDMALGLRQCRMPKAEIARRVNDAAKTLGEEGMQPGRESSRTPRSSAGWAVRPAPRSGSRSRSWSTPSRLYFFDPTTGAAIGR
jgi:ABC-type Fe3+/spermidine/putrescine transport system ATPase subunit